MSRIPSVKRDKAPSRGKNNLTKELPFISLCKLFREKKGILLTDFWILCEDIWNHAIFIMLNNSTDNC